MAKHVLIDGYFLGKSYGFGRFVSELIASLDDGHQGWRVTVAIPPSAVDTSLQFRNTEFKICQSRSLPVWEQVTIPRLAKKLRCDVIHYTANTRALFRRGVPTVTTVHDTFFLGQDKTERKGIRDWVWNRYTSLVFMASVRRSGSVTSVSHATARSLAEFGVLSEVIYNTADLFLRAGHDHSSGSSGRYFVHRGGYSIHRNTDRLIEAFILATKTVPDMELRILGLSSTVHAADYARDDRVRLLPRISDSDLVELYANSLGVLVTSLREGFGLPIIEAFGVGAPVITSNLDPMREIAGGAAILVDPYDVRVMASALIHLASSPTAIEKLKLSGRLRYAEFSSAVVRRRFLEVYERAASGGLGATDSS